MKISDSRSVKLGHGKASGPSFRLSVVKVPKTKLREPKLPAVFCNAENFLAAPK